MMIRRFLCHAFLAASLLGLAACGATPSKSAYFNRGGPESLLDVSSEVVNFGVTTPRELDALSDWITQDQPTRAELYCEPGAPRCNEAQKVLDLQGVPNTLIPSASNAVTLVYERILARDCNPSYVDNPGNYFNTNHPSFGCAVAANMVQHVSDKQEFISPNLSDNPLATRAVTDFHRAYEPRPTPAPYSVESSALENVSQE